MSIFIFFLISISGSIFATVFLNKRFEQMVPLTLMSIITISYTICLFTDLNVSFYIIIAFTILMYILSIIRLVRNKAYARFLNNTLTPGFFIYLILILLCFVTTYNSKPYADIDFAHWLDTVKIMYTNNDFATNPNFYASFPDYTPGISLLQYFFIRINGDFTEWILYFVHKMLALSFILPFTEKLKTYNPFILLSISISVFFSYTLFEPLFYNNAHVDTLVGLTFGFGISILFLLDFSKFETFLTLILTISTLVLLKYEGFLLALSLCILTVFMIFRFYNDLKKERLPLCFIALFSLFFPYITWKNELSQFNIVSFDGRKVDFLGLITLASNSNDNYRISTIKTFITSFFTDTFEIGFLTMTFFMFFVLILVFLFIVSQFSYTNKLNKNVILLSFFTTFIVYIANLMVSYIYLFSEHTALNLVSFQTYIFTIFSSFIIFAMAILIYGVACSDVTICTSLLILTLLFVKPEIFPDMILSTHKTNISLNNEIYTPILETFQSVSDPNISEKIMIIDQNSDGLDLQKYRYYLRPDIIPTNGFSFGASYGEDDLRTILFTAEEFKYNIFEKYKYDYIIFKNVDDNFILFYGELFENPENIVNSSIFKLDHQTKTINLVTILE